MKTEEISEFPRGKELYCPRCYFDDDKEILRVDCKHYKNPATLTLLDVVEHDICRELHFIREKAGKNQLKLIAEITHTIRKVFNKQK